MINKKVLYKINHHKYSFKTEDTSGNVLDVVWSEHEQSYIIWLNIKDGYNPRVLEFSEDKLKKVIRLLNKFITNVTEDK